MLQYTWGVCRDKTRGEQAQQELLEASPNKEVHLHLLDMSMPRKVWEFALNFAASGKSLNGLVNNAGCMVNERTVTEDGLEKNFATNTLGTYILTSGLISTLEKSEEPRIITVSSGGMLGFCCKLSIFLALATCQQVVISLSISSSCNNSVKIRLVADLLAPK